MSRFPQLRMRRMRETPALRSIAQETRVSVSDFIYPIFVAHGRGVRRPIDPMPGIYQVSLDNLVEEAAEAYSLGINAVLLFGLPAAKDPEGTEAYHPEGIVQQAIRAVKRALPDMLVIADVCLDEFTDHGHCGVIRDGAVDNDATLELLARMAVCQAEAGVDMAAPSSMMDGQVAALRGALDAANFESVPIMAYSAKYASAFYGPFRVAADSAPQFGDRRGYQMDIANSREAMREIQMDIDEGADIIMVKPALSYLDVIGKARDAFGYPVAAYNVSGEYAMVKAAAQNEWIDGERIALEVLTSIKRAGADMIITYHAKEAARWLAP